MPIEENENRYFACKKNNVFAIRHEYAVIFLPSKALGKKKVMFANLLRYMVDYDYNKMCTQGIVRFK